MSEKLIIDGVNVSGCFFKNEDAACELFYADLSSDSKELQYGFNCSDNPNCYYKQLARKTQECEELKGKVKTYENLALHIKCPHCYEELGLVFNSTDNKINSLHCYRKALEKIEEYTRKQFCENCDDFNTTEYNSHCEYCEYYKYFDIINKVKGEE